VLLCAGAGCSSSGDGGIAASSGAVSKDAGDDASEPILPGDGAACTPHQHEVLGIKVALDVNWGSTPGTMGCLTGSGCDGTIYLWLLSRFNVSGPMGGSGQMGSGTTTVCGNKLPTTVLSALGSMGEGVSGGAAKVTIGFPSSVWDRVASNPQKAPTAATGVLGGWNVGASLKVDPTVAFFGLDPSSRYATVSQTWPAAGTSIPASAITDDDQDGHPGITATPSSTDGNSLPATGLSTGAAAPQADKLYVALRTELSLYGLTTTCTDVSGKARASLFNEHVIGCHVQNGGDCTPTQWSFIDQIATVYVGSGVLVPPAVPPQSFAPQGIEGTFQAKVLAMDDDGGSVDCAAVRAALP
jgi:hypothetical protein